MNSDNGSSMQRLAAMFEGKIAAADLLAEIEPLMKDYFIGDFKVTEEGIQLKFLNGQTFLLTIFETTTELSKITKM